MHSSYYLVELVVITIAYWIACWIAYWFKMLLGLGGGVGSSENPEHILVHSHPPSHQIRSNAAYNASDAYATI